MKTPLDGNRRVLNEMVNSKIKCLEDSVSVVYVSGSSPFGNGMEDLREFSKWFIQPFILASFQSSTLRRQGCK